MSEKQNTCCKERPENTLSVDDFPSSKEDSFPSLLLPECHTAGMRLLGGRDSVAMTPEALCPGRAPTLTENANTISGSNLSVIKCSIINVLFLFLGLIAHCTTCGID